MEISHLGHACFKLRGKNITLLIDPFDDSIGLKMPKVTADAVLCTHAHPDHHDLSRVEGYRVVIEKPGEYEVGGAQILGVSAFHDASKGSERGKVTCFQIKMDGLSLVHLGDLGTKLTSDQVEELNDIDILMVPTGGLFTISSSEAAEVAAQLEPKIIIPMHYKVDNLKLALEPVNNFLKAMGKENVKPQPKLVVNKDKLPGEPEVVVLE
ncbi:MBL fold metallo-hydrolase [Candidatus Microgenomates bacterium]|nr:MBL fold metallo-hydrolase [Candidatus Microgenomates bacterium]